MCTCQSVCVCDEGVLCMQVWCECMCVGGVCGVCGVCVHMCL